MCIMCINNPFDIYLLFYAHMSCLLTSYQYLSLSLFQSYLYMIMGFYTTIVANDGDAGLCETGFFADGME